METALAWLQNLSAPLQIILVVILCIVFRKEIAAFVRSRFTDEDEQGVTVNIGSHAGENLPEKSSKDWFDGIQDIVNDQSRQLTQVLELMTGLSQHYNHETTDLLSKILEEVRATNTKFAELEKYGFPTRAERREINMR